MAILNTLYSGQGVSSSGGTITGDLTISGDLTVSGSGGYAYSEVLTGDMQINGPEGTGSASAGLLVLSTAEETVRVGTVDQLGRIDFQAPSETGGSDAILVGASIWAECEEDFSSSNNSTGLVFATGTTAAAAEKMRIDQDGNVGIGNASPPAKLTVQGISEYNLWIGRSDLGNASVIDSINNAGSARQPLWLYGSSLALMGGNVGIGVSDPSEELEVKASGDCAILINTSTASNDAQLKFATGDSEDWMIYADGSATNDPLIFYDAHGTAGNRLILDSNSRISLSNNDSGTGGTDSSSGNTLFGYQCGAAITSAVNNSTFFGHNAGEAQTHGDENVAIGMNALAICTKGDQSVAIGSSSMTTQNITTEASSGNTGVGWGSGYSNATGTNNSYIGFKAGFGGGGSNSNNTAVGSNAMAAVTTGTSNVAVGSTALDALLTGTQNTAVGFNALGLIDAAEGYNVAVGTDAGANINGGSFNTMLGTSTSAGAIGATYQTAIGYGCIAVNTDNSVTLGNAAVTDVYMAQDSGATVHCGTIEASGVTAKLSNANAQLWVGEGDGGTDIYMSKGDSGDEVRFSKNGAGSLDILTNAATFHMNVGGSSYIAGGNFGIANAAFDSGDKCLGLLNGTDPGGTTTNTACLVALSGEMNYTDASGNIATLDSLSDERAKDNIVVIPDALSRLSKLKGITFNYVSYKDSTLPFKNDIEDAVTFASHDKYGDSKRVGVIAQDVEEAYDGLGITNSVMNIAVESSVKGDMEDHVPEIYGNVKKVRVETLIPLLVEAVKELSAKVEALEAK